MSLLAHWRSQGARLLRVPLLIQLLKVTAASGLSFAITNAITGSDRGYFAPLAAILVMQGSVAEAISRAGQRIFGVIAGVMVALAFAHFFGINTLSISLLIFFSLLIGHQLKLGSTGISQVAVSALLIMIVGSLTHGYWWERIYETIIGAIVGTLVYAFVLPPDYLPEAKSAVSRFAARLALLLHGFADYFNKQDVSRTDTRHLLRLARRTNDIAKGGRTAITHAWEGLRWNIHRRRHSNLLRYLMLSEDMMERVSVTCRLVARLLDDRAASAPIASHRIADGDQREQLAAMFALGAEYLDCVAMQDSEQRTVLLDSLMPRFEAAQAACRQLIDQLVERQAEYRHEDFHAVHSVFADLQILLQDLHTHHARISLTVVEG